MCFSSGASLAVGGLLIACSAITIPLAWRNNIKLVPFAAYPLFFGIQQIAEGCLWLDLEGYEYSNGLQAAMVFLFFAYWFWPAWVPLSAAIAEPDQFRKRVFAVFTLFGTAGGAVLYLPILFDPALPQIEIVRHSIQYSNPQMLNDETFRLAARVTYAVIVCAPLMLSSHPQVRVYGLLILISVVVSFSFASYAFTSIWCFLAAGLSVYMIIVLRSLTQNMIRAQDSW